ncbi:MAG: class I SAM-dependent methyltransferase [Cyanobacteriota bacterium]
MINYYKHERNEIIDSIPFPIKRVLDIGCGEGFFAEKIKNKFNAEVWGIEINEKSSIISAKKIDKVLFGDINDMIDKLPKNYFDCIFFNDVLEHLVDPYSILLKIKENLYDKKSIIISSIPNLRHYYVLKNLVINKNFDYVSDGILDKTHLRFFTKNSIIKMFEELDYKIIKIQGINPLRSRKFELLNFLLFNFIDDTRYLQFLSIVSKNDY